MAANVVLSLEDLRDELKSFHLERCRDQLKELGDQVANDVKVEFRAFMENGFKASVSSQWNQGPWRSEPEGYRSPNSPKLLENGIVKGNLKILRPGRRQQNSQVSVGSEGSDRSGLRGLANSNDGTPRKVNTVTFSRDTTEEDNSKDDASAAGQKESVEATSTDVPGVVPMSEMDSEGDCKRQGEGAVSRRSIISGNKSIAQLFPIGRGTNSLKQMIQTNGASCLSVRIRGTGSQPGATKAGDQDFSDVPTLKSIPSPLTLQARRFVQSAFFDYVFGTVLIINGIVIGAETNYMANSNSDESTPVYNVINFIFCVTFSFELGCRLTAYGFKFYTMTGWQWNWFDSFIVGVQVFDEFIHLIFSGNDDLQDAIKEVGILRILRLARIVRLVRMVRLIPELKSMVYLIFASMWSFFWAMVLIVLLMYCVAVYYTDAAHRVAMESGPDEAELIRKYWSSVAVSMLSLFQSITGGVDWGNLIEVFEHDSTYAITAFTFSTYVAFATLVMLNLVTGVFVEGAQRIVKKDKDAELMRQVCKAFGRVDDDDSLAISHEEFMAHLGDGFLDSYFAALDLNKQQAESLFLLLDVNGDQSLSVNEFVRGCMRLRGPARSIDLAALAHDFQHVTMKVQEDSRSLRAMLMNMIDAVSVPEETC